MCVSKEAGGLGLRWFNYTLLGKWRWRFLMENDRLWWKVLANIHGEVMGNLMDNGNKGSTWSMWKLDIGCDRVQRGWFTHSLGRMVGSRDATLFWKDY